MKTLILVRHAKSSWDDPSLKDFDRPLNERGKTDAPEMASRLKKRKIKFDRFVSSPAKRAAKTATQFAKAYDKKKKDIVFVDELYLASSVTFFNIVSNLDKKDDVVALFSHNEGITDFANQLTTTRIDNIPTCGVFAVSADIKDWKDFEAAEKTFLFFDAPRLGLIDG